jgi:hypothetical protein
MTKTAYLGYGNLQDLKVTYEYECNEEGETWCDIEAIYIGTQTYNMLEYLSDTVIDGLTEQCIFIEKAGE